MKVSPSDSEDQDRKFKLVVYGIDESPKGTSRHDRIKKDTDAISGLLHDIDHTVPDQSIRDCIRLGKYSEDRKRPVMAEFTRARDVTSILLNRRNLSRHPTVSIKPNLSKEQRKVESILLRKRWELINEYDHERGDIKIKGNSLFVKNRKHGPVHNLEYIVHVTNDRSSANDSVDPLYNLRQGHLLSLRQWTNLPN